MCFKHTLSADAILKKQNQKLTFSAHFTISPINFLKILIFQVGSLPTVGPERATLRSRVGCCSH